MNIGEFHDHRTLSISVREKAKPILVRKSLKQDSFQSGIRVYILFLYCIKRGVGLFLINVYLDGTYRQFIELKDTVRLYNVALEY